MWRYASCVVSCFPSPDSIQLKRLLDSAWFDASVTDKDRLLSSRVFVIKNVPVIGSFQLHIPGHIRDYRSCAEEAKSNMLLYIIPMRLWAYMYTYYMNMLYTNGGTAGRLLHFTHCRDLRHSSLPPEPEHHTDKTMHYSPSYLIGEVVAKSNGS